MPIHIHPVLRNRELALEDAGLIVTLNSDGYNIRKNQEAAGIVPVIVPVRAFDFNGKHKDSKE